MVSESDCTLLCYLCHLGLDWRLWCQCCRIVFIRCSVVATTFMDLISSNSRYQQIHSCMFSHSQWHSPQTYSNRCYSHTLLVAPQLCRLFLVVFTRRAYNAHQMIRRFNPGLNHPTVTCNQLAGISSHSRIRVI